MNRTFKFNFFKYTIEVQISKPVKPKMPICLICRSSDLVINLKNKPYLNASYYTCNKCNHTGIIFE